MPTDTETAHHALSDKRQLPERLSKAILVVFLCYLSILMYTKASFIAGGADPTSYIAMSRLLMQGETASEMRQIGDIPLETFSPDLYLSNGYHPISGTYTMRPGGFLGYPLFISALDAVLPTKVAIKLSVVIPDIALCLLVALIIRQMGLSWSWATFACITVGMSPIIALIGSVPMTDVLSGALATACWLFARQAHSNRYAAIALGACLGAAVLTRLPNALFFVPAGACLLFNWKEQKWWWLTVLAGLPFAIFLIAFNYYAFGNPFSTNYPPSSHLFSIDHFLPSITAYGKNLLFLLFPTILPLLPLSILLVKAQRRDVIVAWLWILCIFGFHALYYASQGHWRILRYTIPAWPALVYCSVAVMSHGESWLLRLVKKPFLIGAIPIILSLAAFGLEDYHSDRLKAYDFLKRESHILQMDAWIQENTEPKDLIICSQFSGSLYHYTDLAYAKWEHLSGEDWDKIVANSQALGYRIFAVLYPFEIKSGHELLHKPQQSWKQRYTTGKIVAYELTLEHNHQ